MSHTVDVTGTPVTANYVWDVNRGVPEILQDGTNTYVYGLGRISSTDGSGNQSYYTDDGLASTTDLTDGSATKNDGYSYDVFGTATHSPGSSANPFQFTGQQTDADSSLQYLRARYYDPAVGRFLGRDSLSGSMASPITQNRYSYAGNNPVRWVDPRGTCFGLGDCGPVDDAGDWAGDRVNDVVATATHVVQNPTNLLNYGVANQLLGTTIASLSSCNSRREKEGGIVIYESCTGGLADLISTINGGKTFTVGSFIFSPNPVSGAKLQHELCHVKQYDTWGLAFLPVYFAVEPLPGTNPFESNADSCAGTHFYD